MASYSEIPPYEPVNSPDNFYAVYTIVLGELIENGLFDWSRPELDWSEAAYSVEQYKRVCNYFKERFYWREISTVPFLEWANYLRRMLVYELMPKYKYLYKLIEDGINPLSKENEYYKNRTIGSAYPETLLSDNADYITDGKDEEFQRIKDGNMVDAYVNFADKFKDVDQMMLDDLESLFISMYTLNINSGW